MNKNILKFMIFITINVYSYEISVKDDFNLIGINKIEFENKEQLVKNIEKLTIKMLENGYVTSKIINQDDKLVVVPGKINRVILEDNATRNLDFKLRLLNLKSLEEQVLNIKDIEKIVQQYNKVRGNKVKVSIDNIKGSQDSNVVIKNTYSPKIDTKINLNYSKFLKYDINFDFNQILGLNDNLELNFTALNKFNSFSLKYSFPIFDKEIITRYKFNNNQIDSDIREKENEISLNLRTNKNKYIFNNAFTIHNKKTDIRKSTNVVDNWFYEFETSLTYLKLVNFNKYYLNILLNSKLGFNILDINKYDKLDYVLTSGLDFNIYSKYYDLDSKLILNKNLKSNISYDRYTKSLNIYGFDNIPLSLDASYKLMYMNNKIKYPFKLNKLEINPFMEFALGTNFKKASKGMSLGSNIKYKNLNVNMKYSIEDTKKTVFNLNTSIEF